MAKWVFLSSHTFQILTAIVAYLLGAVALIKRRMRHPTAAHGVRTEAGFILLAIAYLPSLGIIVYLGFQQGFLAAIVSLVIAIIISYIFVALRGIFYPFLE